jgi:hypothetical protein
MVEETVKKTDAEVLFPGKEVYGFMIKPWTYDQFVLVFPLLVRLGLVLKENGISLDQLDHLGDGDTGKIISLIENLVPFIPVKEIVSKTVGESLNGVGVWEFDKTITIFLVIMIENARRIKNFFGLGLEAIRTLKMAS